MQPIAAVLVCASFAASCLAPVHAQAPSRWADLTVPTGVLSSGLSAAGKLVVYRNGSFLRVFSAATGRWDPMPVSAGTTPVLKPDMLLVPESDRWTVYSAYRGAFAVQLVNLAGSTMTAMDSCAVVQEGSLVHAYSAFTGAWVTRNLPAGWSVTASSRIVVIGDTTNAACTGAAAFDVYRGQWHDLPAQQQRLQPPFAVSGSTALLDFTSYHMAFSALHPTWVTLASPWAGFNSAQGGFDADLVCNRGMLFSGLRGTFNPSPLPSSPTAQQLVNGMIGTLADSGTEWVCSAAHDTWTLLPAGTGSINQFSSVDAVGLYQLGGQVLAYSAATGTTANSGVAYAGFASWITSGATGAVTAAVTNRPAVFSAITGQWHTPPANASNGLPWVSQGGAMLRMVGGVLGFSSHSGAYVPLTGAGITPLGGYQRGVLAAQDSSAVHVFDGHTSRWQSLPLNTAAAQVDIRGDMLLAADATRAIGFGEGSGRFESVPLPQPALSVWADGDVGVVRTANHLLAFAGLPDSLGWSTFPRGQSATGAGTTLFHQVWLPGGSVAILGLGPRAAASWLLPPFGELWLEPGATSTYFLTAPVGESRALLTLPVPDLPGLRNSEWLLQALVLPPSGQAYLGDPAVLRVL